LLKLFISNKETLEKIRIFLLPTRIHTVVTIYLIKLSWETGGRGEGEGEGVRTILTNYPVVCKGCVGDITLGGV